MAIFLDATIVRSVLVPAYWNWYLPERLRRALRLSPSRPAAEAGRGD